MTAMRQENMEVKVIFQSSVKCSFNERNFNLKQNVLLYTYNKTVHMGSCKGHELCLTSKPPQKPA